MVTEDSQSACASSGVARSSRAAWWGGLAGTVAVFALTRCFVLWIAFHVPHPPATTRYVLPESPLIRWDAGHYLWIAQHGYHGLPCDSEALAFFPGYSLVARLFIPFMRADVAMVVVTHLAALIGLMALYAWSHRHAGAFAAFCCASLVCCYPPAMYFSVGYADAVLFACVAVTLLLLERGWLLPAALVCGFATLTRPTALALAAVVVLHAWLARTGTSLVRRLLLMLCLGTVSVSGFLAYQGYLWHLYDRPDAFFAAQQNWHAHPDPANPIFKILTLKPVLHPMFRPFKYIARRQWDRLFEPPRFANPFFNLVILVLAVWGLRRPGTVPRVFYLLPILVFLMGYLPDMANGGRLIGIARYQLIALPCFLLLTRWMLARWRGWGVAVLCLLLLAYQGYYIHLFACQVLVS